MAKKKTTRPPAASTTKTRRRTAKTADEIRAELDLVDRELLKAVNDRAKLAKQYAQAHLKEVKSLPSIDNQLQRTADLVGKSRGPLDKGCLRRLFHELSTGSAALLKPLRVAFLGPEYSYSHLATIERFGESATLIPVSTIATVFETVARGQADYGMVPIENSTDGRIADTLTVFTRIKARICGEVDLPIHHCLLAKCPRSEISEVYSKPQALSQCREWLERNLPGAKLIPMTSTTAAAKLALQKPGAAAVASREAGMHFELNLIAEAIEDNKNNTTRFAVIGLRECPATGDDKTSLMFQLPHKPGSLADALAIFKKNRLNMTWIESFPRPDYPAEYLFFAELLGHETEANVKKAITALEKSVDEVTVLGSFARNIPCE